MKKIVRITSVVTFISDDVDDRNNATAIADMVNGVNQTVLGSSEVLKMEMTTEDIPFHEWQKEAAALEDGAICLRFFKNEQIGDLSHLLESPELGGLLTGILASENVKVCRYLSPHDYMPADKNFFGYFSIYSKDHTIENDLKVLEKHLKAHGFQTAILRK